MLSRISRAKCLARFYGFEDMSEKWTKNWWQYAESNYFGDASPEERGYQLPAQEKEINKTWGKQPRIYLQPDRHNHGQNPAVILDRELRDNPLGDYDTLDETIPLGEIKTRLIHILRHFEKADLRKIDWKCSLLNDMKFDEFERIAFLTSVEHEFNTLFEDSVFDNLMSLDDVIKYLNTDRHAF